MKELTINKLNVGDIFEIFVELTGRMYKCVYTGKRVLPRVAKELGVNEKDLVHCFVSEYKDCAHSLVAYGDEVVTKLENVNDWIKVQFIPSEACDVYNHHKHFTLHDGVYRRHNTYKLMQKFIIAQFGVRQVTFDEIPENQHHKIIW